MEDILVLNVNIKGSNIMRDQLLKAHGLAVVDGKRREIYIEMPITSTTAFIEAFEQMLKE